MSKNVATKYGKLAGEEVAGVHVFRGVPFARPPLGALRFAPPQPPAYSPRPCGTCKPLAASIIRSVSAQTNASTPPGLPLP